MSVSRLGRGARWGIESQRQRSQKHARSVVAAVVAAAVADGDQERGKGPEKKIALEKHFAALREREKRSDREKPIAVVAAAVAMATVAAATATDGDHVRGKGPEKRT